MKVILDSNFLVYAAKKKIDYISELSGLVSGKIVVLSSIIDELANLKETAGKREDKDSAGLAMQMLKKNIEEKKACLIKTSEKGDESIIKAVKEGDLVVTMDKELKRRLKGKVQILGIRQGEKLEIL